MKNTDRVVLFVFLLISLSFNGYLYLINYIPLGQFTIVQQYPVLSEKYFYNKSGSGGLYDNGTLWCSIKPENDSGQVTYVQKSYLYGSFRWSGRFTKDGYSWSMIGLSGLHAMNYIAFEFHMDGFRATVYKKPYTNFQGDPASYTESLYIEGFDPTEWHDYKIVWKEEYIDYFIDNTKVAHFSMFIPEKPLFFHLQTCASPNYPAPENSTFAFAKDIRLPGVTL